MENKTIFGIGLIVTAMLVVSSFGIVANFDNTDTCCSQDSTPVMRAVRGFSDATRIIFKTEFPELDEELTVYKLIPDIFDQGTLKGLGRIFDIEGDTRYVDRQNEIMSDKYVLTDESKTLEYFEDIGRWHYVDSEKAYPTVSSQPDIPTDQKSREIAENFLKSHNLWSENLEFTHVAENTQGTFDTTTSKIIEEYTITKKIYFSKDLNGLSIVGAGGKCYVTIGENEEVVAFSFPAQQFKKVETAKVISPDQAIAKSDNVLSITRTSYENRTAIITDIYTCYYVGPTVENKGLVYPCYNLVGYFEDSNERFSAAILAVET